ncbi:MerR family transcriptional regulator [Geoalkalibacter halelectricus]|uniref:MerR family transcriptional regulator n=1 Tax=Geoalkalibacter halelectricus TaxID=2847045 RepID=A0ABY5ZJJ5_9BACT|nr:MerR family transcriptional regulator [Geoalkalibacter halelectricus]MDO3379784.1 MerR family transcriptional regulator [Geoalkalibacter halelectricus]UWZ79218.1 MerR family transcriptional regulator [Geoalkalibacter halelectricus]
MTIQELSRETGIGIDTLRIWERRYGEPTAKRDSRGHRNYAPHQIEELRTVKKLQNLGLRPARIFALSVAERERLLLESFAGSLPENRFLQHLVEVSEPEKIAGVLEGLLKERGLRNFIFDVANPLVQWLDRSWSEGRISIAREHLVSDELESLLHSAVKDKIPAGHRPRMLFLTLSGERHKLGLLMAAALFHLEGFNCLVLREELPLSEVPQLALELNLSAVALSFSIHYPRLQGKNDLIRLRRLLDPQIKLLSGGHAMQQSRSLDNLIICTDLKKIPNICRRHFPATRKKGPP